MPTVTVTLCNRSRGLALRKAINRRLTAFSWFTFNYLQSPISTLGAYAHSVLNLAARTDPVVGTNKRKCYNA